MTVPGSNARHFGRHASGDPFSTPPSVRRLADVAVSLRVGPYFTTAGADPVQLQQYADSVGRGLPDVSQGEWARLGTDQGLEICADHYGTVRAVLLDSDEPPQFVNATPEVFVRSLGELERALGSVLAAGEPRQAREAFRELERTLRALDEEAFAERENWWPLVLDDIRDTASAEWFTAFEIVDGSGEKQILTGSGGIGVHPEERLWEGLRSAGVAPEQVLRIHTELEACFMPGHYCALWLARDFPDAELTHNFPYGETAASRAEGIRGLREAAEQPPPG